jgi:hypothetical protein
MADAQGAVDTVAGGAAESRPLQIETNGINVITDAERKGHPRDLFWPWFAANISVLGLSYGAFLLAFGISFGGQWWRRGRDRHLVPAVRVHRHRQAGVSANDGAEPGGVRGPRQQLPTASPSCSRSAGDHPDDPGDVVSARSSGTSAGPAAPPPRSSR